MKVSVVTVLVVIMAGCSADVDPIAQYAADNGRIPRAMAGVEVLRAGCPSLQGNADRYKVTMADQDRASLTAQREFDASKVAVYSIEITDPEPGAQFDVASVCSYEVAITPRPGVITSKEPCIRLCDVDADTSTGFMVKKT